MRKLKTYEEHVKEKYPGAYEVGVGNFEAIIVVDVNEDGHPVQISEAVFPKTDAWKSAYDKIKTV